jgi:peptidoglycan/xylan/chitin deacetylase (PgdA/CDA1 family)
MFQIKKLNCLQHFADIDSMRMKFLVSLVFIAILSWIPLPDKMIKNASAGEPEVRVPILLYHRFGPVVADSMTITTPVFEAQLKFLKDNGYTVIPLRQLIDYCLKKRSSLPNKSVVITADDGHKSVYTDMYPLLKKYHFPATLFLYPSALSNASYAMTYNELRELQATGLFDFQGHTFWHPNFKTEKKRLAPVEYGKFVEMQLKRGGEKIEREFHVKVDMLAWPFGIYDDELAKMATATGYVAAFSMERHHVTISDNLMTLPRYLIGNTDRLTRYGL